MPTNDPNYPDPSGPKPPGVSDAAWYGYTSVDSTKPLAQWTSWEAEGKYDPSAKGYARFKSSKVDSSGNPIQGLFEHPDACPDGTTAYGQNQCLPIEDPRIQGSWNIDPRTGKVGGDASGSATPTPPPPPTWDTNGVFNATGSGDNANAAKTSPLQGMLQDMFSQRSGTLFGKGPTSGSLGIDGNGNALPVAPTDNRQAKALGGGGLMWTEDGTNLGEFGNKTQAPAPVVPAPQQAYQPPPQPEAQKETLSNSVSQAFAPPPLSSMPQSAVSAGNYWQAQQPQMSTMSPGIAAGGSNLTDILNYQKQMQAKNQQQPGQQQTKASALAPTPFPSRNGIGSAAGF